MMGLSLFASCGHYTSSTRGLLALLFMAEICGYRLLDQNPVARWLPGPYLGFLWLHTLSMCCISPFLPLVLSQCLCLMGTVGAQETKTSGCFLPALM